MTDPADIDFRGTEDDAAQGSSEQHPSSARSFYGVLVVADMFQDLSLCMARPEVKVKGLLYKIYVPIVEPFKPQPQTLTDLHKPNNARCVVLFNIAHDNREQQNQLNTALEGNEFILTFPMKDDIKKHKATAAVALLCGAVFAWYPMSDANRRPMHGCTSGAGR